MTDAQYDAQDAVDAPEPAEASPEPGAAAEETQLSIEAETADDIALAVEALRDTDAAPAEKPEVAAEAEEAPAAVEAAVPEPAEQAGESTASTAPAWPFIVHGALWVIFSAAMTYFLLQTPDGVPTYEASLYPVFLFTGLALTVLGPFLIVAVWLAVRARVQSSGDLFLSALFRGSVATMAGVALWWAALLILDQVRLGRLL